MINEKKLSSKAYEIGSGDDYPPVISASENIPEFTLKAVLIGCLIGAVFGAANAFLGLKVGLTVSASIPAAVMAVAIFKIFRSGTLLETNMVQTIGSAGESLAAGVIFTVPAFFLWNLEPGKMEIVLISILGGVLGVLFMIPLRRFLIVREHGKLPYPEGTACAEVQVCGQGDASKAKALFVGMGLGGLYQFMMNAEGLGLWTKEPYYQFQKFKGALLGAEITPELLGVGYIIGPRIAAIMLGGGLLGWFVLIPVISLFGALVNTPVYPESVTPLSEMGPWGIWSKYVRYIGAGGVAFAGIFALLKSLPIIIRSFSEGLRGIGSSTEQSVSRTQQDLPMRWILPASMILSVLIAVYLCSTFFTGQYLVYGLVAAFLIVLFSFFFVTVSSRIVGLLGSSSNPVSGMTIATLVITSLLFLLFGLETMPNAAACALTVGAFVCIAAAMAGDTSQDLKTGFLLGATPRFQQIGEFLGVISVGLTMGIVMYGLKNEIVSGALPAPQANLMKLVIDGVLQGSLPWALVLSGIFVAVVVEMLGINSLAFAVGLYLPMSLSVPIMVGGLIRWWIDRGREEKEFEERREAGILYCSGLIAGAALVGLILVLVLVGFRDNMSFVGSIHRVIKKPGIHLHLQEGDKILVNGAESKDSYLQVTGEIQLEWIRADSRVSKQLKLGEWDKTYLHRDKDRIYQEGEPPHAIEKGVLAFTLLALSLIWIVRKRSSS